MVAAARRLVNPPHIAHIGRMKTIARVETTVVDYEIVGSFRFFAGPAGRARRSTVVVNVTSDDGRVGWGQCVPSPTWSYETVDSVKTTIDRYLAPAIVGRDLDDTEGIWRAMHRAIAPSFSTGQPICKAGIDLALTDLTLASRGLSVAQSWGRGSSESIRMSWTIDVRDPDELDEQVDEAERRGYRDFNLKVGADPRWDVDLCRRLRAIRPDAFVWADANGGYDLDTALDVVRSMADLGIAALEQPVPANRLSWYGRLCARRTLPILMDEAIVSVVDLEEFHRLGLLDGVAMKVSRCGGLSESRRILDYVERAGLLFFASGLTDPDLSLAASLHLFAAYGLERPAALNGPQFLAGSILEDPIRIEGDRALVPSGAGLGVRVDARRLEGRSGVP
ncbi:MAG: mandelate racemase [Planctomycetes bacterium]|nr:mandelate racemase [Planctomycetota bacterium]